MEKEVGKNPVTMNVLLNRKILEQVSHFCFLGRNVKKKFDTFQTICGTIGTTSRKLEKMYKIFLAIIGGISWATDQDIRKELRLDDIETKIEKCLK